MSVDLITTLLVILKMQSGLGTILGANEFNDTLKLCGETGDLGI